MTHTHGSEPFDGPGRRPAPSAGPLARLDHDLAARSRGAAGREAMARWARAGVPIGSCADPLSLARSCRPAGGADDAIAVVRALSGLVPGDETAGLCLLAALRPVLEQMARWLTAHGTVRAAAEAAAMAALWEAASAPGHHEARNLFRTARNALRQAYRVERRHTRALAICEEADAAEVGVDVADSIEVLLGDAERAGALRAGQAELLLLLYVHDLPAHAVARRAGRSARAVSMAKRRAERALGTFVTGGEDK